MPLNPPMPIGAKPGKLMRKPAYVIFTTYFKYLYAQVLAVQNIIVLIVLMHSRCCLISFVPPPRMTSSNTSPKQSSQHNVKHHHFPCYPLTIVLTPSRDTHSIHHDALPMLSHLLCSPPHMTSELCLRSLVCTAIIW